MSGKMFVITDKEELISMEEVQYDSEALLQILLGKYPDLLAGDQMNPTDPRRWLLVGREIGLASEDNSGDRWSVDHLFIDQDAIPTIIEVKRSTDTRIRREVVGQMLDYAANAVMYWPVEKLRIKYEEQCERDGVNPDIQLEELIGCGDVGEFWTAVDTNIKAGKIRMVFASDSIPSELKRIVEFMNSQMNPAEVLALEIKQFKGVTALRTMVPTVLGQTLTSDVKRQNSREQRDWDQETFLTDITGRCGVECRDIVENVLVWAKKKNLRIWWGKGRTTGSFYPMWDYNGKSYNSIGIWSNGTVEIQFQYLYKKIPDLDSAWIKDLLMKFEDVLDVQFPADVKDNLPNRRPTVTVKALRDEKKMQDFLAILDEIIDLFESKKSMLSTLE